MEHTDIQEAKIITEWEEEDEDIGRRIRKPGAWVKGQSGNPAGRPKGPTIKEWVKERMLAMNDEERDKFLEGIPKLAIWEMIEGKAQETKNISVTVPRPILGGITQDSEHIGPIIASEVLDSGTVEDTNEAQKSPTSPVD